MPRLRGFTLFVTALTLLCLAHETAAVTPVTLCVIIRVARTSAAAHAVYAADYFKNEYPNLQVTPRLVGRWESGGTTTRNCVRAFAANGTDCTIVVGPGSSSIAQGVNPVIDSMWLDFSATATTLSDRAEYTLFSRVVPTDTDATAGAGYFMAELKWNTAFVICADNPYGQSVTAGIAAAVNRVGGTLVSGDCVLPNAPYATLVSKLNDAAASSTRIIYAGMSTTDALYKPFIQAVLDTKIYLTHVVIFSESACSSLPFAWAAIPGSFCATFAVDSVAFAPFYGSYKAADKSNILAMYDALSWPRSQIDLVTTAAYPAMAADASRFALRAYSQYIERYGVTPPSSAAAVAWLRNQTMTGFSGAIRIPTGDRSAANMVVYNSAAALDGSNATVIIVAANTTAEGNVSLADQVYCLQRYRTRNEIPTSSTLTHTEPGLFDSIGPAVIVPCLGMAILALVIWIQRRRRRDLSNAPKDTNEPFTIVFTDIQSSTSLWARDPEAMGTAVDLHHDIIRRLITKHRGYEVKTVGDCFMVAFKDTLDALRFSIAIQLDFFKALWPPGIDDAYKEFILESDGIMPAQQAYADLWNGLRVRVGLHAGHGDVKFDEVAQAYDYYGTVVNTASRVESVGNGGMVLLTQGAMDAVKAKTVGVDFLATVSVAELGPQPLRGLDQHVSLYNVQPKVFAERKFPSLRLDIGPVGNDRDEVDSDSGIGPRSSAGSFAYESDDSTPQRVIHEASRRINGVSESMLMDEYVVVKALMSTTPIEERLKAVTRMAQRWRVDTAKILLGTREQQCDVLIAKLAVKVLPVAVALRRMKEYRLNNTMMRSADSVSLDGSTSAWAAPRPQGAKSTPILSLATPNPGPASSPKDGVDDLSSVAPLGPSHAP